MVRGKGLARGLRRTLRTFFTRPVTVEYPKVKPDVHPRYRGSFTFDPGRCIGCELCARACPNRVIALKWEKGEAANRRRVTEYRMRPGLCLFCGLCAEACPTRALAMTPRYELATRRREKAGMVDFRRPAAVPPPDSRPSAGAEEVHEG